LNLRQEKKETTTILEKESTTILEKESTTIFEKDYPTIFTSTVLYSARGGSGASVHCIIQCQRRIRSFPSTALYSAKEKIRSFPSTVLYSARGGSGASRPLHYTVPEEDPELPLHCIIQGSGGSGEGLGGCDAVM